MAGVVASLLRRKTHFASAQGARRCCRCSSQSQRLLRAVARRPQHPHRHVGSRTMGREGGAGELGLG